MESLAASLVTMPHMNKYGDSLGEAALRSHLKQHLHQIGIDTADLEIVVTAGANQAFNNLALTLCDSGDKAVLIAPFFYSHKLALQLAGAEVSVCGFDSASFAPDFVELESRIASLKPKVVVLTSPNNPSGYVYTRTDVQRTVRLCKEHNAWLVVDQTYYEFLYDDAQHVFPCGKHPDFAYDKIVHLFSFSKIFGMPGWRVGFLACPKSLTDAMEKIQDTIPVHAARISQDLALQCMKLHYPLLTNRTQDGSNLPNNDDPVAFIGTPASNNYSAWARTTVGSLVATREALWPVLAPLGTIYTKGAFYFLVPVPPELSEDEAVDILARQFSVLLMYGTPFGAPNYLRLSYANLLPEQVPSAVDKVKRGYKMGSSASKEPVMTVRLKPDEISGALVQLDQLYIVRTEVVKSEGCFGGSTQMYAAAKRREEAETKATIDALEILCNVAQKSDRNFDLLAALQNSTGLGSM
eukprot:gene11481-13347_t